MSETPRGRRSADLNGGRVCATRVSNLRGTNGPFRGPWKHLALQIRLTIALGDGQVYSIGGPGGQSRKSGLDTQDYVTAKACSLLARFRLESVP
jgi:hypothetical protein